MNKATIRQNKYDKDHTVRYNLKLNKDTDKDIINKIEDTAKSLSIVSGQKISKQGAIKYLLRHTTH